MNAPNESPDDVLPRTPAAWHARVLALTWPVVLSNLSLPLVGLVDTAVMGRLPDPAYIGAVALGAAVFHAAFWTFSFLKQGTTGEVAQAHGAGDAVTLNDAIVRSVVIAFVLGLLLAMAAAPVASLGFWLMRGSVGVEVLARDYFMVRVLGAPATLVNLVVIGVLIGTQRARMSLALQLLLNLTNVALSVWFVLGLGLGVRAVAAASVIADMVAAGAGLLVLARMVRDTRTPWLAGRTFALDRLRRLAGVNRDIMIRSLCLTGAFFYFTSLSASFGDTALAANVVLLHFMSMMAYGLDGFAHTAEALAGGAYGRGSRPAFRDAVCYSTGWAFMLSLLASALFALFGADIVALLTTQPAVRAEAAQYLPWLVVAPVLSVWCFQLDGIFIGTLRTVAMRNAMLLSVLAYAACVHWAMARFGNHGLWGALLFLNVVRALSLGWYLPSVFRSVRKTDQGAGWR